MPEIKLYPLADRYGGDMRFNSCSSKFLGWKAVANLRAKMTGEFRPPKKGEWYISGAIPEAYRAPNDFSEPYYIARIVLIDVIKIERVIEVLP